MKTNPKTFKPVVLGSLGYGLTKWLITLMSGNNAFVTSKFVFQTVIESVVFAVILQLLLKAFKATKR